MAEQVPPKKSSYWSNVVTTLAIVLVVLGLFVAFNAPMSGLILTGAGIAVAALKFFLTRGRG